MARRPLWQAISFELSCFALSPGPWLWYRERRSGSTGSSALLGRIVLRPPGGGLPRRRLWPGGLRGAFALLALRFLPDFCAPGCLCLGSPRPSPARARGLPVALGLCWLSDKCDPLGLPIGSSVHVLALQLTGLSKYFFSIAKRTITDLWSRPQFYRYTVCT
jgi:hypothetical protein